MALAHTLGFPHTGRDRELQTALEAFRNGELDDAGLRRVGQEVRAAYWQTQKDAGIDLLPVGDFVWCDPVLSHSLAFGVIPGGGKPTLQTLLATAQGGGGAQAAQWFDTDHHYRVPEFSADQQFELGWEQLFEEVDEALALGHTVKPVLIGPLTYLWLGKLRSEESGFDKLELLERLLPVYGQIFQRLAAQGVEWVQLDEPVLVLDLPQDWKNAFERAYNLLQREPLKKLIATYFGGLEDNLGLAASLPLDGLHVDLVSAPRQYLTVLDRLPSYKVLSLGLVSGGNDWDYDLESALDVLHHAHERLGERLWVASSCPAVQGLADAPDDSQAIAAQKCAEVALLARAVNQPDAPEVLAALAGIERRRCA